jgi:hypothetical protein
VSPSGFCWACADDDPGLVVVGFIIVVVCVMLGLAILLGLLLGD